MGFSRSQTPSSDKGVAPFICSNSRRVHIQFSIKPHTSPQGWTSNRHIIGLVFTGKSTGNHIVFTMKYRVFSCKFSHKPIQRNTWNLWHPLRHMNGHAEKRPAFRSYADLDFWLVGIFHTDVGDLNIDLLTYSRASCALGNEQNRSSSALKKSHKEYIYICIYIYICMYIYIYNYIICAYNTLIIP